MPNTPARRAAKSAAKAGIQGGTTKRTSGRGSNTRKAQSVLAGADVRETKRNPAEHLREHQFQPGQSGNPEAKGLKGCKHGLRARLRRLLKKEVTACPEHVIAAFEAEGISLTDADVAEVLVERLLRVALSGDMAAFRLLFEQTEKPLKQTIGIEGDEDAPITFILPPAPPGKGGSK